jgi:hypothetical protein
MNSSLEIGLSSALIFAMSTCIGIAIISRAIRSTFRSPSASPSVDSIYRSLFVNHPVGSFLNN